MPLIDSGRSVCYPLNDRPLCITCHVRVLQRQNGRTVQPIRTASSSSSTSSSTPHQKPTDEIAQFRHSSTDSRDVIASLLPVVDVTIDDDQASWESSTSCCDVIAKGGTSSIVSSVDHIDDVIESPTRSASSSDTLSDVDNDVTEEDERRRLDDIDDDEKDNDGEDDGLGCPRSDSAASDCGGGADSGHGSGTSDDTLTSSDAETLDASTPTTPTSGVDDNEVDGRLVFQPCFGESTDDVCVLVFDDTLSVPGGEVGSLDSSSKNDLAQLIARQLNCVDLDSCRVTDL